MSSEQKSLKRRESFWTFFIFTIIFGYATFLLVSTQQEIAEKQDEYDTIHSQLSEIEDENEQLLRYSQEENRAEYIEEIARDKLGYAHPQEQIFYVTPSA